MKNIIKNNYEFNFQKKALVSLISAVFTTVMTTGITQASDIDLYQSAKSGDITLMFLLDLSGSMDRNAGGGQNACDLPTGVSASTIRSSSSEVYVTGVPAYFRQWCQNGNSNSATRYYDRLTKVKDGMIDLLYGNTSKGIQRLDDDKVIGLSTFQYSNGTNRIPARPLGQMVGLISQRQLLINTITGSSFAANGRTPTANAYADAAAYLLGTTTRGISQSGFSSSASETKSTTRYIQPNSLSQTEEIKKCSGQGIYVLTDGEPNESSTTIAGNLMRSALSDNSFNCTNSLLSEVDNPSYGFAGAWSCIGNFSQSLLSETSNPANLRIKTAVVGFGSSFNGINSYNKNLTQAQNIANINNASISGNLAPDIRNAARWGVYGDGGWYSGSDSQDIVDSVNAFISSLATEIPPISTGSPTIPNDALYPAQLQNFAYYPQFDPTPDKSFQLWAGNLKKYRVSGSGKLVDKLSAPIVESSGKIVDNYDLWSPIVDTSLPVNADISTIGSKNRALMGGAKSQLLLKFAQSTTTENRKLLTNRVGTSGSNVFTGGTKLRQVKTSDISDSIYKNDPNRGYLISLLGFDKLDVANPSTITSTILSNAPELRQVGAVMHSSPLLLTNEGKITAQNNVLTTTDRKDFVLFGTTQGLLHVVDAVTGKEKFAFVPNEMVENQKEAFLNYDTTSGGINNMFYGIDAPWTSYTEYVVGNDKLLTVGSKTATSPTGVQMVYGGLRMGGSSYYALDLQNIEDPKLKFHIDPVNQKVYFNNSSKSFPQLSSMGQSWSKPQIAWIRWNGERKRVMLVGGGYDSGYESDKYNQTNAKGAGVYMFDAENGDLLWWSSKNAADTSSGVIGVNNNDLKYSVVSEIRSVDSDEDGLADNLYFGDLGGQLWRVDLDNKATSIANFATKPVRLLNLNSGVTSPRFYDMPAFSVYSHNGTKFAVISVGSGNRSQPLAEYTFDASNYSYDAVYNIYDKDVARADLLTTNTYKTKDITLTGVGALKEIDNTNRVIQTSSVAPYETSGWFYQFKSNKIQSAKVVGTPSVMNYRMYVSYFDASKPGLSGDCGAGVKGESFLSTFCMPFGQCDKSTSLDDLIRDVPLGAGLQTTTTGNDCEEGQDCSTSTPIPEPDKCVGDKCSSHTNQYCISTGGRVILTPQGGTGGAKTMVCLTPIKWYEKLR